MSSVSNRSGPSIAVWIVEDDIQYRQTVVYLLNHTSDLHCAAEFFAFEEIQALVDGREPWTPPDVVLMDIGLPGVDGIQGVAWLKTRLPGVPIVMLTLHDDADMIFEALRAGASGYLLKDTPLDQTLDAIREAFRGGSLMPAPVAVKVLHFFRQAVPREKYNLTKREHEILGLMADGYVQKQIAEKLWLSPHTVDNHIRHIYEKLHVHSGIEAVAKAIREQLI